MALTTTQTLGILWHSTKTPVLACVHRVSHCIYRHCKAICLVIRSEWKDNQNSVQHPLKLLLNESCGLQLSNLLSTFAVIRYQPGQMAYTVTYGSDNGSRSAQQLNCSSRRPHCHCLDRPKLIAPATMIKSRPLLHPTGTYSRCLQQFEVVTIGQINFGHPPKIKPDKPTIITIDFIRDKERNLLFATGADTFPPLLSLRLQAGISKLNMCDANIHLFFDHIQHAL
jgi:hypothetical protein